MIRFSLALLPSAVVAGGEPVLPLSMERVFESAPLVLVATTQKVALDGKGEFAVKELLRPAGWRLPNTVIAVDLSGAPAGMWPALGEAVVLALNKTARGYALSARVGAVMPAEEAIVSKVRALVSAAPAQPEKADKPLSPAVPTAPLPDEEPAPKAAPKTDEVGPAPPARYVVIKVTEALETQVQAADVVAIGQVAEVALSDEQNYRARLRFLPEQCLKGGGLPGLLEVYIPAPETQFGGQLPSFRIGRYCLFLASRPKGGGLDLVSPYYGAYHLEDEAAVAKFKERLFATEAMKAISKAGPVITTVQALVAIWEEAWNHKNLARLIACYSRKHDFYRMYAAGKDYRMALERKLRDYPASVRLKIERVDFPLPERAEVLLELSLEADGAIERRGATMRLAREEGEWRIVEEGF